MIVFIFLPVMLREAVFGAYNTSLISKFLSYPYSFARQNILRKIYQIHGISLFRNKG